MKLLRGKLDREVFAKETRTMRRTLGLFLAGAAAVSAGTFGTMPVSACPPFPSPLSLTAIPRQYAL